MRITKKQNKVFSKVDEAGRIKLVDLAPAVHGEGYTRQRLTSVISVCSELQDLGLVGIEKTRAHGVVVYTRRSPK